MGGRDALVADEERGGTLRRGIKPEIGDITGAVEGDRVAKIFDGDTSGGCVGISPSKVADDPS